MTTQTALTREDCQTLTEAISALSPAVGAYLGARDEEMDRDVSASEYAASIVEAQRLVAAARAAYESARGQWDDADWTHELRINGERQEGVYCEGGSAECEDCQQVVRDAEDAEEAAERAMTLLDEGDIMGSLDEADRARRIEGGWGDAPTWRPLVDAIRRLAEGPGA